MIALTSTISSMSGMEKVDHYISDIARDGGHAALEKLYLCTKDAVYGYALSILKNTHDAEDVLHDCFINIYHAAPNYKSSGKPMAWILTITKNLCMNVLSNRNRISDIGDGETDHLFSGFCSVSPEDKFIIHACIDKLSPTERKILVLHAVAGFKHREIASFLDLPLSTVLSKYSRAVKKVQNILESEE